MAKKQSVVLVDLDLQMIELFNLLTFLFGLSAIIVLAMIADTAIKRALYYINVDKLDKEVCSCNNQCGHYWCGDWCCRKCNKHVK